MKREQKSLTTTTFESVGIDVWREILKLFCPQDLICFQQTCYFFHQTSTNTNKNRFWSNLCKNLCGSSINWNYKPKHLQWCQLYLQLRQFIITNKYVKCPNNMSKMNSINCNNNSLIANKLNIKFCNIYKHANDLNVDSDSCDRQVIDVVLQACKADCEMIIDMFIFGTDSRKNVYVNDVDCTLYTNKKNRLRTANGDDNRHFDHINSGWYDSTRLYTSEILTVMGCGMDDDSLDENICIYGYETSENPLNVAINNRSERVIRYLLYTFDNLRLDAVCTNTSNNDTALIKCVQNKISPAVIKLLIQYYINQYNKQSPKY